MGYVYIDGMRVDLPVLLMLVNEKHLWRKIFLGWKKDALWKYWTFLDSYESILFSFSLYNLQVQTM